MSAHLHNELEKLKKKILGLSVYVEESVNLAVQSVIEQSEEIALEVIANDYTIDEMEVEVEEECLKILALHQPVAIDLRFIVAVLKINNDLERIGDIAVNIAERSISLIKSPKVEMPFNFMDMSQKTRSMLSRALSSLIEKNLEEAYQICKDDAEVDEIHSQTYKAVYREIQNKPEAAEPLIHCLSISKHLERISDYTTNIAEDLIYMVEGRIVRHNSKES